MRYLDSTGRRVASAQMRRGSPLPPRRPRVFNIVVIAPPIAPRFNSCQISYVSPHFPSDNYTYENITNTDNWGLVFQAACVDGDSSAALGLTHGVALNALFRNDPSLQVIKVSV